MSPTWIDVLEPAFFLSRQKVAYNFADGARNWKPVDSILGLILQRSVHATQSQEVLLTIYDHGNYFAINGLRGWLPSHSTQGGVAIPADHLEPYTQETAQMLAQNPHTANFPPVFDSGFEHIRIANARLDGDGIPPQALGPYFRIIE